MFSFMRRRSKLYIFVHNLLIHILHLQKPKENIVQRQASKRLVILVMTRRVTPHYWGYPPLGVNHLNTVHTSRLKTGKKSTRFWTKIRNLYRSKSNKY